MVMKMYVDEDVDKVATVDDTATVAFNAHVLGSFSTTVSFHGSSYFVSSIDHSRLSAPPQNKHMYILSFGSILGSIYTC